MNSKIILGLLIAVICRLPTEEMLRVVVLGIITTIIIAVLLHSENKNKNLDL